jgi:uncharacterized membrane protein YgdD (TMEM256/DUF423 family)
MSELAINKISVAKLSVLAGILLCLTSVALGAFGAHALEAVLIANQRADVYELASRYQFYHGLALIGIAALFYSLAPSNGKTTVLSLMFFGTLIFSGSLYILAITNISWFGAITPIGGLMLIASWIWLAFIMYREL